MVITTLQMFVRMAVGVALGGVIGLERERTGRQAGLRTHLLVALASSLFMLVSTQFVFFQHYTKESLVTVDTSRIAASVVTGIGFLGAGAILRTGISIQGLTTAASLWLVAAVGLAAGGGMFPEAVAATVVALIALVLLRRLESKPTRLLPRRAVISVAGGISKVMEAIERMRAQGIRVSDLDYERNRDDETTTLTCDLWLGERNSLFELVADLESIEGVRRVEVVRPA